MSQSDLSVSIIIVSGRILQTTSKAFSLILRLFFILNLPRFSISTFIYSPSLDSVLAFKKLVSPIKSLTKKFNTGKGKLLFILLNPSKATEKVYDATIIRCEKRSKLLAYKQFRVCNLFAFRSTKPTELKKVSSPEGSSNNMFLKTSIKWSDKIICSWGRFGTLHNRDLEVIQIIKKYRTPVFHLGLTKNNQPIHLLYVSYNKILTKWL